MSVSKLLPIGGANDFNLNLGGTYTSVTLNKEYSSGSYSITSGNNDTTLDIYAYNTDGSLAGYTNTKSFSASKGFNKIVVIGGQSGDVLGFTYKTTYTTTTNDTEVTAGPYILSVTTTSFPSATSTAGVTGGNFASDITGTFTSAATSTVYTATITRNSSSSLTIGRPATLPTAYNPYILTLSNPGVSDPIGSSPNKYTVNAGTGLPTWVTTTPLPAFTKGEAYSQTLSATDSDGGAVTYSIVSGSLPAGLTLNGTTGVISGTPTNENAAVVVFRATDAGNNIADITLTIPNTIPTISNTSLSFAATSMPILTVVNDGTGSWTVAVTGGSLPTGVSLSTSGVFSGNCTVSGTGSVTLTVTDSGGQTSTKTLTTNFRSQAAGTTFAYNSLPATFLPTDIISGFPVGTTTSFSIPSGVNSFRIICSGAGGASPSGNQYGGTGGYVAADYTNLSHLNSPIQVAVGEGGKSGAGNQGGGGGGYTGVRRNDGTWLLMAGAGGSTGGNEGQNGGYGGNGAGGNLNGTAGGTPPSGAGAGAGGTTTAGGSGGYGGYNGTASSGGFLYGGSGVGGDATVEGGQPGGGSGGYGYGGGGGGGAGWYGGGGGGTQSSSGAGGGGGSGYYNTSYGSIVSATVGGGGAPGSLGGGNGTAGYVRLVVLS